MFQVSILYNLYFFTKFWKNYVQHIYVWFVFEFIIFALCLFLSLLYDLFKHDDQWYKHLNYSNKIYSYLNLKRILKVFYLHRHLCIYNYFNRPAVEICFP